MVIYEVNLTIEPDQINAYSAWLEEHIREMLELEGFESAALYARSGSGETSGNADSTQRQQEPTGEKAPDRVPEGQRHWTVHYHLDSRDALDRYFEEDAERMRSEGSSKFEGQFTAERRVLESRQVFSHQER